MIAKKELVDWLETIPDDAFLAINAGGLCLLQVGDNAYLEVGGEPDDDESEVQVWI